MAKRHDLHRMKLDQNVSNQLYLMVSFKLELLVKMKDGNIPRKLKQQGC